MKTKLIIGSICLLLVPFTMHASKLYVLYDAKCMDKLEYDYSQSNEDYTVYHVNVSAGEKVILEVGRESKDAISTLPTPFIGCSNGSFDLRLVDRINKRIDEVFMVYPRGNKYFVSPISFASYYEYDDQTITYISPKYAFKFDRKQGAIGENISSRKNAKVYFEGQLENDCNGILLFRQFSSNSSLAHTDLMLVPEVGVVEERSGANLEDAQNNAIKIDDVNGKSYERYLKSICNQGPASAVYTSLSDIPQEPNVTPVFPTQNQPELVRKDGSVQPLPTSFDNTSAQKTAFHTVKKGETLYAISRKYDVTVSQIKEWNNKSGNMIRAGENLRVSNQNDTAMAQPELTAKSASWQPTKTTSSAIANQSQPTSMSTSTSEEYHIVQPGETVPSIAMKYGYTEAKFREMNNLGSSQFIKIGQKLKTTDCNCPASASNTPTVFNPVVPAYQEDLMPRSVEPTPYSQPVYPSGYSTSSSSNMPTAYEATQGRINTSNYSYQPENTTPKGGIQYYDTPVPQPSAPTSTNNYYRTETNNSNYYPSTYPTTPSGYQGTSNQPDFDEPVMPQSYETVTSSFKSPATTTVKGKRTTHLVGEGETLYSIARKYGISVEYLRNINNMERNEVIIPYQRIFIN